MSEVERLAFLEERDKFLNEECARIAQLPDPTYPENRYVVSGCILYSISSDGSGSKEEDVEAERRWHDWVLDEVDDTYQLLSPEEDDSEVNIFAQPVETDVWDLSVQMTVSNDDLELDRDLFPAPEFDPAETFILDETRGVEQELNEVTEDKVFVEYLKMLNDEELTAFLASVDNEHHTCCEEEFTTAPSQLPEEPLVGEGQGLSWLDSVCQECLEDYSGKKRCLACNRDSCITCLCRKQGWKEEQRGQSAWVCSICEDKTFAEP